MRVEYCYNSNNAEIYFSQENMNKSSTYLSICEYGEFEFGKYVKDYIQINMTVEGAEKFIEQFQDKLNKYKQSIKR